MFCCHTINTSQPEPWNTTPIGLMAKYKYTFVDFVYGIGWRYVLPEGTEQPDVSLVVGVTMLITFADENYICRPVR